MANEKLARRYALAVFQLAQEQSAVVPVRNDLHSLANAIYADEAVRDFFLSPVINRKQKEDTLAQAFQGRAHDVALHTVLLLVRKRRESLLRDLVRQYDQLEMQARGAELLTITSAKQLDTAQLQSLVGRLEQLYEKKFDVSQRVDPELIGGVRIMLGDLRIDGSVAGRLEELSRTLFAQQ